MIILCILQVHLNLNTILHKGVDALNDGVFQVRTFFENPKYYIHRSQTESKESSYVSSKSRGLNKKNNGNDIDPKKTNTNNINHIQFQDNIIDDTENYINYQNNVGDNEDYFKYQDNAGNNENYYDSKKKLSPTQKEMPQNHDTQRKIENENQDKDKILTDQNKSKYDLKDNKNDQNQRKVERDIKPENDKSDKKENIKKNYLKTENHKNQNVVENEQKLSNIDVDEKVNNINDNQNEVFNNQNTQEIINDQNQDQMSNTNYSPSEDNVQQELTQKNLEINDEAEINQNEGESYLNDIFHQIEIESENVYYEVQNVEYVNSTLYKIASPIEIKPPAIFRTMTNFLKSMRNTPAGKNGDFWEISGTEANFTIHCSPNLIKGIELIMSNRPCEIQFFQIYDTVSDSIILNMSLLKYPVHQFIFPLPFQTDGLKIRVLRNRGDPEIVCLRDYSLISG